MTQTPQQHTTFSTQDEQFMREAIKLAAIAEQNGEVPVGAILVQEGKIIAEGLNLSISSHDATAHAEIQALREAGKKLSNYRLLNTTLYVTLEPCLMCAGALLHARVGRVVYGASDLKTGAAGTVVNLFESPAAFHYAEVQGGLLESECKNQLQAFFKRRRKEIKEKKRLVKLEQNRVEGDIL